MNLKVRNRSKKWLKKNIKGINFRYAFFNPFSLAEIFLTENKNALKQWKTKEWNQVLKLRHYYSILGTYFSDLTIKKVF